MSEVAELVQRLAQRIFASARQTRPHDLNDDLSASCQVAARSAGKAALTYLSQELSAEKDASAMALSRGIAAMIFELCREGRMDAADELERLTGELR